MTESLYPLRVLREVVRQGSLTRAAEVLGVSQPAISSQVKLLEQAWGMRLLERGPRGASLQPGAEHVYLQALRVLSEAEELHRMAGLQATGPLEIAVSTIPGIYWLPYRLPGYSGGPVFYRLGKSAQVVQWVLEGAVPMGIVGRPSRQADLEDLALGWDRLQLMACPSHPWHSLTEPKRQDFGEQVLWIREKGSATRHQAELLLGERLGWFARVLELPSEEALKHAVIAGLGMAVLSSWSTRRERRGGWLQVLNFSGERRRRFYLTRLRALPLRGASLELWQFLCSSHSLRDAVQDARDPLC